MLLHAQIDQWFGVFSRALTREEALGFPAYSRVLKSAFALEKNAPDDVKFVERVHDWDQYMPACISLILDIRPPARPGVPPSWCAGGDNCHNHNYNVGERNGAHSI